MGRRFTRLCLFYYIDGSRHHDSFYSYLISLLINARCVECSLLSSLSHFVCLSILFFWGSERARFRLTHTSQVENFTSIRASLNDRIHFRQTLCEVSLEFEIYYSVESLHFKIHWIGFWTPQRGRLAEEETQGSPRPCGLHSGAVLWKRKPMIFLGDVAWKHSVVPPQPETG